MNKTYSISHGKIDITHKYYPNYVEFAGEYTWTISRELVQILTEYINYHECKFLIYDMEEIMENVRDSDKTITFGNADMFIVFVGCVLENTDLEKIKVESEGDHPFWIWHDICHALKDDHERILAKNVGFTAGIERDRLMQAASLAMNESDCDFAEVAAVLFSVATDFQNRFGEPLFESAYIEPY